MKNKKNNNHTVSIRAIPFSHWLLMAIYIIFFGVALWQFILPFLAERYFREGYNLGAARRYKYAIEELEVAITYAPWETHYMTQLGKFYEAYAAEQKKTDMKLLYYRKTEALYRRMIVIDRLNPWYQNRLGLLYAKIGKLFPDQAAEYQKKTHSFIKRAAELDHENPLFLLHYATYLHRLGALDDAKPYYLGVIDRDPRIGEAFYNLADIHRKQGNLKETLALYERLYKINPTFQKVAIALASTYIRLNQGEKAIPILKAYISDNPNNLEAHQSLAALYQQAKEWEKAADIYRDIFTSFGIQNQLKPYYIQALLATKRFQEAVDALKSFIKEDPSDAPSSTQLKRIQEYLRQQGYSQ